jgi:ligand-binding sensor domain-containing protein
MLLIRRIFLIASLLLCCKGSAQNIIPRFETLGVNDGLSQSSVYSIYQDKKGYMWLGTADGLNRYDGKNIKVYNIEDRNVAYSNFIRGNLSEDQQGCIWFSNETGIFFYDPTTDQLHRKLTFNTYRWTQGLLIDTKNIFYLIDPASGIYAYNIATGRLSLTGCKFSLANTFISVFITTNRKNTI